MESLCGGLNAMPFPTEARKCSHWATRGLLELGRKCNVTYMHMKCTFYWQANLAFGNVLRKNERPCISYRVFYVHYLIFSKRNKTNVQKKRKRKKKIWSPSAEGWTPCPSQPKLGNVTTELQGNSLNWVANVTLPMCTWNVVFIDRLILHWEMCNKKTTDLASVIEFFYVHYLIVSKQYKTNVQKKRKRKKKIWSPSAGG